MAARVMLVRHGASRSVREARFPAAPPLAPVAPVAGDDPISRADTRRLMAVAATLPADARWWVSPDPVCVTSAAAMRGHPATPVCRRIRPIDYGSWAGLTLGEVATADPEGAAVWAADARCLPADAECLDGVRARLVGALDVVRGSQRPVVAIATGAIIRMTVLAALDISDNAFWYLDIDCCSITELAWTGSGWRLVQLDDRTSAQAGQGAKPVSRHYRDDEGTPLGS